METNLLDYPKKVIVRFTPRRYMRIAGLTEHQLYMKQYMIKYRQNEDNRQRMLKSSKEYTKRFCEKKKIECSVIDSNI
jgi:hypothetical protein